MHEQTLLSPVAGEERIRAMDVLRGFALLGILLMNIEGMAGTINDAMSGLDPRWTGPDRWADVFIYIFVQGKFYPLFSLLFGMGFAVMMVRATTANRPFAGLYLRRTFLLLLIGLGHALLVWSGDVLTSYALVALVLLVFFRRTPVTRLPKWAIALLLWPVVMLLSIGGLVSLAMQMPGSAEQVSAAFAESAVQTAAANDAQRAAFGGSDYGAAVAQRLEDLKFMMTSLVMLGPQLLGLFLLGSWFVRSGAIARPGQFPRLFSWLRWVAWPLGLALCLLGLWIQPTLDYGRLDLSSTGAMALNMVGGMLMALGYLAWIVLGLASEWVAPKLAVLAPAGRMALTNYLTQSIVCTLVFYGYGLGYFEQLPRAWQAVFAVSLFALQVAISHAWLARFRFGPMEWLWRAGTYLQLPAMRRG